MSGLAAMSPVTAAAAAHAYALAGAGKAGMGGVNVGFARESQRGVGDSAEVLNGVSGSGGWVGWGWGGWYGLLVSHGGICGLVMEGFVQELWTHHTMPTSYHTTPHLAMPNHATPCYTIPYHTTTPHHTSLH